MNIKAGLLSIFRRVDDWIADRFGRICVLFVVRNEVGFTNQVPVIREMLKDDVFRVRVTADNNNPKSMLSSPDLQVLFDKLAISPGRAVYMKWHYLICTDILNIYFKRNKIHADIGHGVGFGSANKITHSIDWPVKIAMQPSLNIYFKSSPFIQHHFENSMPNMFDPSRKLLFASGFPKLDPLVEGHFDRTVFLEELSLRPERKTVVIASHWTKSSLLNTLRAQILEELAPLSDKINIVLTCHPHLWKQPGQNGVSPAQLWHDLTAIADRHPNIRILKSVNTLALLNAADVLLCDNSSILIEYSTLDRPILFFKNPTVQFTSETTWNLYKGSGENFSNLDGLASKVMQALATPEAHARGREALRRYFLYNNGKSAATIVKIIKEIGRISSPRSPAWDRARALEKEYSLAAVDDNISSNASPQGKTPGPKT